MADKRVTVLATGFPTELKRALARSAPGEGLSMNDLAVKILADEFKVRVEPSGRPAKPQEASNSNILSLRMPEKLRRKIRQRAVDGGGISQVIADTIAAHFEQAAAA
jgi:hypothetical protein